GAGAAWRSGDREPSHSGGRNPGRRNDGLPFRGCRGGQARRCQRQARDAIHPGAPGENNRGPKFADQHRPGAIERAARGRDCRGAIEPRDKLSKTHRLIMKALSVFLFASLLAVRAQTPAAPLPDLPDETVVCTFDDGVKLSMGEFKKVYGALPPQLQQMAITN